jgi:hypothetical protein
MRKLELTDRLEEKCEVPLLTRLRSCTQEIKPSALIDQVICAAA